MSNNIWDWVKSITYDKNNLLETESVSSYEPYVVNKSLSYHLDCVLYSNEMNQRFYLDKDMQYSFYLNSLRKMKRYSSWTKKKKIKNLEYVKKYYGYNNDKAYQALDLLTEEQTNYIIERLEKFGFINND
jgi:hypothetical protein